MSPLPPSLSLPDNGGTSANGTFANGTFANGTFANGTSAPLVQGASLLLRVRKAALRFSGRVGWTLYTVVSCFFFLVLTFPTDLLLQRVVSGATRGTQVRVHYAQGELTWWGSCRLREVEVATGTAPVVKIAYLTIRPSLIGLMFGRPWPLSFTANLYGGTLSGSVTLDASEQSVRMTAQHLDLRLLPLPGINKGGEVHGLLSGEGEVRGNMADLFSLQGQVTLTVAEGALRAGAVSGFPLPSLSSAGAQLRATVKKGLVDIADFTLQADNVEARLSGSVLLVTPLPMSTLNLQMTAKAPDNTASPLKMLISLLPAPPDASGVRRASISGSLAAPILR
jgi:type II secretion system protein N